MADSVVTVYSPSASPESVTSPPGGTVWRRSKPSGPATATSTGSSFGFSTASAPPESSHALSTTAAGSVGQSNRTVRSLPTCRASSPNVRTRYSPSERPVSVAVSPASTVTRRSKPPGPVTATSTGRSFGLRTTRVPPSGVHSVRAISAGSGGTSQSIVTEASPTGASTRPAVVAARTR